MSAASIWEGLKTFLRGIGHTLKWSLVLLWWVFEIAILSIAVGLLLSHFYPKYDDARWLVAVVGLLRIIVGCVNIKTSHDVRTLSFPRADLIDQIFCAIGRCLASALGRAGSGSSESRGASSASRGRALYCVYEVSQTNLLNRSANTSTSMGSAIGWAKRLKSRDPDRNFVVCQVESFNSDPGATVFSI